MLFFIAIFQFVMKSCFLCSVAAVLLLLSLLVSPAYVSKSRKSAVSGLEQMADAVDTTDAALPQFLYGPSAASAPASAPAAAAAAALLLCVAAAVVLLSLSPAHIYMCCVCCCAQLCHTTGLLLYSLRQPFQLRRKNIAYFFSDGTLESAC